MKKKKKVKEMLPAGTYVLHFTSADVLYIPSGSLIDGNDI